MNPLECLLVYAVDLEKTLLVDCYDRRVSAELGDWMRETGTRLDPSYA